MCFGAMRALPRPQAPLRETIARAPADWQVDVRACEPAAKKRRRLNAHTPIGVKCKVVRAQYLRQIDRGWIVAWEADHVAGRRIAEDVLRIGEEILRIEQRGDVPPQAIAKPEQKRNELWRF